MAIGFFKYEDKELECTDALLYAIYENYGHLAWYIELVFDEEKEKDHILLNNLDLGKNYPVKDLQGKKFRIPEEDESEMYAQDITLDEFSRLAEEINLEFSEWQPGDGKIKITGKGILEGEEADPNDPEDFPLERSEFHFEVNCEFNGYLLPETTEDDSELFIIEKLQTTTDKLEVEYETIETGLLCRIKEPITS